FITYYIYARADAGLDRHVHNVAIGFNQLVAYLHHGLERYGGLLRCNHYIGDINSWRALFVSGGHCRRCFLYFVNLVDGLRHYLAKARCFIDTFDVNRAELAHATDFIRSDALGALERLRLRL